MKPLNGLLMLVLFVEIGIGAFLSLRRVTPPPRPPVPALDESDARRGDLETMAAQCKTADDWHRLAEVYSAYGFYAEAETCYDYLLTLQPENPQLLFEQGFLLSRMGQWREANARLQAAIASGHPAPADAWFFIGRNHLRAEQPAEAARAFALAEGVSAAQVELARLEYRAGNADRAISLLQPVLAKEADKIEPNLLAYLCALKTGDRDAAQKYAERAADTNKRIFNPFHDQWLRLDAVIPQIGFRRRYAAAEQQARDNRIEQSEQLLLEARNAEWNEFTVDRLAKIAAGNGDFDKAIAWFQELIDRRGPSTESLAQLAEIHVQKKDYATAVTLLTQALEARTRDDLSDIYAKLAAVSRLQNRNDDARRYAALSTFWKGKAAFWQADWKTAAIELEKASQQLPESEDVWFSLAEVNRRLGNNDSAAAAYKRCLAKNPTNGRAIRGLNRLVKK